MPLKGSPYRILLILFAAAFIVIPAAVLFFNDSVNLTGTAVQQTIDQNDPSDSPGGESSSGESDDGDSGSESASSGDSSEGDSSDDAEGDSEPEENSGEEETPPDDGGTENTVASQTEGDDTGESDPDPQPTDDESGGETDDDTNDDSDDNATEEPSGESDSGDDDDTQPEATEEPGGVSTPRPESTEEPRATPTPGPETTEEPSAEATETIEPETTAEATAEVPLELTAEVTAEATAEVTAEPVLLDVTLACEPGGVVFTLSNAGADMPDAEPYHIDGEPAGEFQLDAGESTTISAGFGTPLFTTAGISAQPGEPCLPPPALEVSAVCTIEDGAVFVISNSGGPMPEPQSYTLDGEEAGEFQLDEGGTAQIEAGYGSPVFASGDLNAALEEVCDPPGSISGVVWLDVDGDGTRGDDEAPIAEITITLTASDGSIQEALSAEDGSYSFANLRPGDYSVQITTPPAQTRPSYDLDGEADSITIITVGAEAVIANFGYQPLGTISGGVWLDVDGDGTRGENETAIAEMTITLTASDGTTQETTSAEDGSFAFADLPYGDYSVQIAEAPAQTWPSFDADGGADSSAVVSLSSEATSADFGYQPLGTISGAIWLDVDGDGLRGETETPIAEIAVSLTASDGTTQETTSAGDGSYTFGDLPYGDYTVSVANPPAGALPTYDADGGADSSAAISLSSEASSADFGYQPELLPSIMGTVWADLNGDGLRTDDEPGLSGIAVTLTGANTETQAITDAGGIYSFAELPAGDYSIFISRDVLGENFIVTAQPAESFTLADTPLDALNFGLRPTRLGTISGLIWLETGDFGVRNTGESGIAGVVVELLDSAGTVLQSVTLEADGAFAFVDLLPGAYAVRIVEASLPDRLFVTYNPDGSGAFITPVLLPPGTDIENIEFGLVGAF